MGSRGSVVGANRSSENVVAGELAAQEAKGSLNRNRQSSRW